MSEQTAALTGPVVITEPGVYDIPAANYHDDPVPGGSLSSTGARQLLACPARYRYDQDHPAAPKTAFDVGSAAHRLVLGAGPELVRIDADEWRSNAVKAMVADVRARGAVPLKPAEWAQVHGMAAAIRSHPLAAALLQSGTGAAEQTLAWQDGATGVWCRAMVDWLPHAQPGRRMVIVDYKSAITADPREFCRSVANYGYHIQEAHYLDGVAALGLDPTPAWKFVVQEKTAPYLVSVVQLDESFRAVGRSRARLAREIYRDCEESGMWPGYPAEVATLSPPRWLLGMSGDETYNGRGGAVPHSWLLDEWPLCTNINDEETP
jgi:hypothetical protein